MKIPSLDARERTTAAVVAITVLALLVRFVLLGDRVAHWDEARVGYWTLDYMRTGSFEYRPIIHGPLYHHVNPLLFDVFGISDTTMRIVPAVVTGLLPLTALLFRDRLRGTETAALALFLAVDPIFLYYSRFMRGDPLVGAFMLAGFAFLVRAIDTGQRRHVLAGVTAVALGFTTKENAFVYVLCWIGALALVLDQRLLVARYRDERWLHALARETKRTARGVWRSASTLLASVFVFVLVIVFFYAPRSPDGEQAGLKQAVANPVLAPGVIEQATLGSFEKFYGLWGDGGMADHGFVPFFVDLLETLGYGAVALCLFAVVGFLWERYATDRPRDLVTFTFYWGAASVFVYPIITDIPSPWAAVHVVLPLMIPAAVGVALVLREGRTAFDERDWVSAGLVATLLVLATVQIAWVGLYSVYLSPQSADNELVQYAQPADDLHPTLHEVERIAERNEGTDVLVYGSVFVDGDPIYQNPSCAGVKGWYDLLPMPWYLERSNADVVCAENSNALGNVSGDPPVVISTAAYATENRDGVNVTVPVVPEELEARFPGYDVTIRQIRTTDTDVVFLIDRDRVDATGSEDATANTTRSGVKTAPVGFGPE